MLLVLPTQLKSEYRLILVSTEKAITLFLMSAQQKKVNEKKYGMVGNMLNHTRRNTKLIKAKLIQL